MKGRLEAGRLVVHALLGVYGLVLAYILLGLIFDFSVSGDVFFGLSFALLFFALGQSVYELGAKNAVVFLVISSAVGFLAEALGTNTGIPFGKYHYTNFLGQVVLGVPIVVPLVWFVISYVTFSLCFSYFYGQRPEKKTRNLLLGLVVLCAFGAMAWDLLIDPMFSSYGYWVWDKQVFPIPEISGIPISNFVGWFVVAFIMVFLFVLALRKSPAVMRRRNIVDSRIVYVMLLIDGSVANFSLGASHYAVIAVGLAAMGLFLYASYMLSLRQKQAPAKEQGPAV